MTARPDSPAKTDVPIDGGDFLRVIFVVDIEADKVVQYPEISITAPFSTRVPGRKASKQTVYQFSPKGTAAGQKPEIVTKLNETNTVRFMIPLSGSKVVLA